MDKNNVVPENGKKRIRKPAARRLVQLYAALLYNANLKGFIDGHIYSGDLKAACVPGFNCYSCPGAIASCPLGALQNALSAAGHTAPWYILGILTLFGVMLGRTICGWICPLGLIQELLHKIPTPKIRKSRLTRKLSYLKYAILAVFVIAIPLFYGVIRGVILPGFCKYICPAGTLEGAVGILQNPANSSSFFQLKALFTNKWVIMLVIGLACVFCYRSFCRFLCPLGAIYGFFNRFAVTGVKVNPERCNNCGACVMKCQMDVRHVGDHECISCGKCMDTCAQGAISLKCGKITLKGPEIGKNADPEPVIQKRKKAGRIAWCVFIAILVFALGWFNLIEPAISRSKGPGAAVVETASENTSPGDGVSALMTGTEVGNVLPDFATDLISGERFQLSKHRGQVVIINFWAITCAPCIEELPYYEQLKTTYPDVEILAVHHKTGAGRAPEYLSDKGWDHLDFALDSKEKGILPLLNASDAMPQTIVVNKQGVVTYNAQTPLTYEKLEALYLAALADTAGAQTGDAAVKEQVPESEPAEQTMQASEDGKLLYSVTVTDPNGTPVPGVMLGFCTDTACRNSEPSDENGSVSMTLPADRYHLQVIVAPEAFEGPENPDLYLDPEHRETIMTLVPKPETTDTSSTEESEPAPSPSRKANPIR